MQQETQKRVKDTLSTIQQIPKEEQIPALDFIVNGVAIQRNMDIRELCYDILRRHPIGICPSDGFLDMRLLTMSLLARLQLRPKVSPFLLIAGLQISGLQMLLFGDEHGNQTNGTSQELVEGKLIMWLKAG